jgi:hypothetical protein
MSGLKTGKPDDSEKDKISVNFYISGETFEKIDDVIYYVRKRLPMDKRRKLSKSVIYEACLKIVLEEYNAKGESSSLWKAVQELMAD